MCYECVSKMSPSLMLERCLQDVRTMLRSGAPPNTSVARSAKLNNKNTILTKTEMNPLKGFGTSVLVGELSRIFR